MNIQRKNSRILFWAIIFFWFAQYVYIPFQTPYLTRIGTSAGMVGMIIGAYGISQVILRLPVGVLADCRNRHKQFIMIGGLSSGLASIFRVVLQDGTGFFIANLFSGLASAMWISFMVLYMSYYPTEQQKATSQIIFANNLGILAGFATSTFLYEIVGMKVICIFSIISGFLCAIVASRLSKGEEQPQNITVKQLLRVCFSKRLILFSLLALVQQGVQMATAMSFTTQIIRNLGANIVTLGMASIIYMVSAVFWSKFASTELCERFTPKSWITFVFCTTAVYCLLVPMGSSILIICLLQILPGMTTGILFSFLTSEAMKGVPTEKKSTAMGFFQAVYALGITIFPAICGKIVGIFSMTTAYFVLAMICFIAAGIAYLFSEKVNVKMELMKEI